MYSTSLFVADQRHHALYALNTAEPTPGEPTPYVVAEDSVLAEHAGMLQLPDHRIAYLDDAAGELRILAHADSGRLYLKHRVSVAIPGEHLAVSPDGAWVGVGTGFGAEFSATTDQITLVHLYPQGDDAPRGYRVRTRPGEHGIALSTEGLWLRHREPGAVQYIPFTEIIQAGPHVPQVHGVSDTRVGNAAHGEAFDPQTETFYTATENGLESFRVRTAENGAAEILPQPKIDWAAGGGARAFFLRCRPAYRQLATTLRAGGENPRQWHNWPNWVFTCDLDTGTVATADVGPGLVFRCAQTPTALAVTRVHPDGDELVVFNSSDLSLRGRWALPGMDRAPRPGHEPWDDADRRAIAAHPNREEVAVSRGGHGQVHLIDVSRPGTELKTVQFPSPLRDGGHLGWFDDQSPAREFDTVGR